ncbi:MAG: proline--tRNA ligase, partial [Thermodesulfobacteriota bacterium]|nr:proline--tRNA ligase [Thermodesulfobacteriota bacterium]
MEKGITSRSEDFPQWYNDVVMRAELADYSPVKGCMVIRPYGYAIWENVQRLLDKRIKDAGHENAYFPLFIPESFLSREADHVEGFAPECAVVTHGGGKKLEENLYVRPTSETIMYAMYSKWIRSWRDLPVLINQWGNVVRWEMRTRLFLRTTEFLWQEGHTAHATAEEAEKEVLKILGIYKEFAENVLAIPVYDGVKTDAEKFAGAAKTCTIEAMMQDRKALQLGTSHDLGQNFSKAFNVSFQDKDGKLSYVWQTSWGVSTRLIGAIVMAHGDDKGLVLPPRIAPVGVVIIPIYRDEPSRQKVMEVANKCKEMIGEAAAVKIDDRDQYTPGYKFNDWELRGVPLRVEIGPRDVEKGQVVLVRRDTGDKEMIPQSQVKRRVTELLDQMQISLFERCRAFRDENTVEVDDFGEFSEKMESPGIFARSHWCGDSECEATIKEKTKATIRCVPFDANDEKGECVLCRKESKRRVIFAR